MSAGNEDDPKPREQERTGGRPSPGRSRFLSLLTPPAERPTREAEADPLQGSAHSAHHELAEPHDDYDRSRARTICAAVTRELLRDFAPGLLLLGSEERLRTQALVAFSRTLLDFAGDSTLEGERLSQINRWQFALERALAADPPGQPIFVQMAHTEKIRPWPRAALDELLAIARARISAAGGGRAAATKEPRRLAAAGVWALTGEPADQSLTAFGEGVLRAHSLLAWHDGLWLHRPDLGLGPDDAPSQRFRERLEEECRTILRLLGEGASGPPALSRSWRPAARYLALASRRLARLAAGAPDQPEPPRLSAWTRVRFVVRALWS